MESADVVIAGGGIMGCALAYQLAKRDVDVILLERDTLGSQSTGKCAGGVRQQFSMEANVRLQRLSVRLFEDFEQETGQPADFRQIGYLFVLTLPQQVEDFRSNMEMWHRAGLTEARWVDPAEAARMVPVLNVDDVLGCTFCPTDGIASPADVTSGYASAARRRGARLKEGVEVIGIAVANGRVHGVGRPLRVDPRSPGDPRPGAGGRGFLVCGRVQRPRIHAGPGGGAAAGAAAAGSRLRGRHQPICIHSVREGLFGA